MGVTLLAVPVVSADHSFLIPAGEGCSFDVLVEAEHLPEPVGIRNPVGFGNITLTNLDTGATYLQRSRHLATETFDPETNTVTVEELGRIFIGFFAGDQGPNGLVEEPGALLAFSGSLHFTVDPDTFVFTEFSHRGKFVDLCAELSE